jgi:hypothetical protein
MLCLAALPAARILKYIKHRYGSGRMLARTIAVTHELLSIAAALLFVLMVGVWVRSYYVGDRFRIALSPGRVHLTMEWGLGGIGWFREALGDYGLAQGSRLFPIDNFYDRIDPPRYPDQMYPYGIAGMNPWRPAVAGFHLQDWDTIEVRFRQVTVPIWSLVGFLSAILMFEAVRLVRIRRLRVARAERLCLVCGYDLRATRDRCPECGAIPPASKDGAT